MYVQRSRRPSVVKQARTRWPGQSRLGDVEPDCPRALPNLTPPLRPHRARHRSTATSDRPRLRRLPSNLLSVDGAANVSPHRREGREVRRVTWTEQCSGIFISLPSP